MRFDGMYQISKREGNMFALLVIVNMLLERKQMERGLMQLLIQNPVVRDQSRLN